MKKNVFLLLSSLFLAHIGFSQKDGKKTAGFDGGSLLDQADEAFLFKNYSEALPLYLKLESEQPGNPLVNYKIGVCYLNSTVEKQKAVKYLEYSSGKYGSTDKTTDPPPPDVFFYLGKALHLTYKLDEAIGNFTKYKSLLKTGDPQVVEADRQAAMCEMAKELMKTPVEAAITNLGSTINSPYPEYSPVISADESVIIFTSRRQGSTGERLTEDGQFFEDIYISYKVNDEWIAPVSIGTNINGINHEASIGLSADGQQLFIYRDENADGNIYVCNLIGDTWSVPQKLGSDINTKSWEPSASLSADGSMLYFVSDRRGGFGGRDIYKVQRLPNGHWGSAQNLGSTINTAYDEDGPFIHPDGITLYFSSNGHTGMGGFDIFSSQLSDSGWSAPKNIGYPINSTDDDVFYVLSASGKHAYYSSVKEDGKGEKDIYLISFTEKKKEVPLTVMKGTISVEEGFTGTVDASIVVTDNETGELVGIFRPNAKTGKYLLVLQPGRNYNIAVEANGFLFHSENLRVAAQTSYSEISKAINLAPIKVGSSVVLKNIFFDTDKATLRKESHTELERLVKMLSDNKSIQVEISGHTDDVGNDKYNLKLSEQRAQSVVNYLKGKGIDAKRMTAIGFGESKPITGNDTEEGRQQNRRTEFKIIGY